MTNAELIASARVCGSHNGCNGCKTEDRGPDCAFDLMLALADALEKADGIACKHKFINGW